MLRAVLATLAVLSVAVGMASAARADKDEFSRPGCYVGVSGAYARPYAAEAAKRELEDTLNDSTSFFRHFGYLDAEELENGWTVGGWAGCRNRWAGGEVRFEWLGGVAAEASNAVLAAQTPSSVPGMAWNKDQTAYYDPVPYAPYKADRVWSLTADAKIYPLKGRIQPFATIGFGYLKLDAKVDYGPIPVYVDDPETPPTLPTQRDQLTLLEVVDGQASAAEWDFVVRAGGGLEIYVTKHVALTLDAVVVIPTSQQLRGFRYFTTGGGCLYRF